jgi:endoglucanase
MKWLALLLNFVLMSTAFAAGNVPYIRINQVGYLEKDVKKAIIGSSQDLTGQKYSIKNVQTNQIVLPGTIGPSVSGRTGDTPFLFNYIIDFSSIETKGSYVIELEDKTASHVFKIGDDVYKEVIDTLLYFMQVERCGNTQPKLHTPCHLNDATNPSLDLTGGWHDAGDFLKFSRNESYVTYTLLLSYEINKEQYGKLFSDSNNNGLADVLDEAKIGVDYLVKLYPNEYNFVYQVGDFDADHSQGWRMPENDKLASTNRPALFKLDRTELSKYAYTLALAFTVFRDFPQYKEEAVRYLNLAKTAYSRAKSVGSGSFDTLCLAATELYRATAEAAYLEEAKSYNDKLYSSDWGGWSDNTNLAHARLGEFYPDAIDKLSQSVIEFRYNSHERLFGYDVLCVWGALYVAIGSGSSGWFYKLLTGDAAYDDLARRIRDYTLGLNPWGVSFISGLGTVYPMNVHNNVAVSLKNSGVLKEATFPGAMAQGPLDRAEWLAKWSKLVPSNEDIYGEFNTADCVYHDHINDYVTNEPSTNGASEAILFFSFYLRYLADPQLQAPDPPENLRIIDNNLR